MAALAECNELSALILKSITLRNKTIHIMLRNCSLLILGAALCCICLGCCQKEEASPLIGTSWESPEDGSMLFFDDGHSGRFYCKSTSDGVSEQIFQAFDFVYELTGDSLVVQVTFSNRVYEFDGTIRGNVIIVGTANKLSYVKIECG